MQELAQPLLLALCGGAPDEPVGEGGRACMVGGWRAAARLRQCWLCLIPSLFPRHSPVHVKSYDRISLMRDSGLLCCLPAATHGVTAQPLCLRHGIPLLRRADAVGYAWS
jgi:hypothetical protein